MSDRRIAYSITFCSLSRKSKYRGKPRKTIKSYKIRPWTFRSLSIHDLSSIHDLHLEPGVTRLHSNANEMETHIPIDTVGLRRWMREQGWRVNYEWNHDDRTLRHRDVVYATVKSDAPTNFIAEVSTGVTNVDEPRSDEQREKEYYCAECIKRSSSFF